MGASIQQCEGGIESRRSSSRNDITRRVHRAMDYLRTHLAEPLSLERIASQAYFSPHHFVRVFAETTGETPLEHLRRIRLERAALSLYRQPALAVLNVALANGFQSSAVFARAFRSHFGMSASDWRRGDFWHPCGDARTYCWRPVPCDRCDVCSGWGVSSAVFRGPDADTVQPDSLSHIALQRLPPRRIAYMRAIGPYEETSAPLLRRMMRWRAARGLLHPDALVVTSALDAPEITSRRFCRYDAGQAVDAIFSPDRDVNVRELPGGLFVTARFTGSPRDAAAALRYLCRAWIPGQGYTGSDWFGYTAHRIVDSQDGEDIASTEKLSFIYCLPVNVVSGRSLS